MSRLHCPNVTLNWSRELSQLFGPRRSEASGRLATSPDLKTAHGFIARAAGITPREWKNALIGKPLPGEDPYLFSAGLYKKGTLNETTDLSDTVMSKRVKEMTTEFPEL